MLTHILTLHAKHNFLVLSFHLKINTFSFSSLYWKKKSSVKKSARIPPPFISSRFRVCDNKETSIHPTFLFRTLTSKLWHFHLALGYLHSASDYHSSAMSYHILYRNRNIMQRMGEKQGNQPPICMPWTKKKNIKFIQNIINDWEEMGQERD